MATWKQRITKELKKRRETWNDIESITPSDAELAAEFDDDHGGVEGKPFTAWTTKRVYFPVEYDVTFRLNSEGHPVELSEYKISSFGEAKP